jgi:hypothetical protein
VPYAFVTEAKQHPPFPRYRCPALIIHGLRDTVVPVEISTTALLQTLPEVIFVLAMGGGMEWGEMGWTLWSGRGAMMMMTTQSFSFLPVDFKLS